MPTFVYMTRCDGCGHCVDICPSDIMHIDKTYRRAFNIEPNMCWECYSCVKACPQYAIDCRGYADFAPLGHSVRVRREEEKGTISWKIKFRDGREKDFVSPIRTTPWGSIQSPAELAPPTAEMHEIAAPRARTRRAQCCRAAGAEAWSAQARIGVMRRRRNRSRGLRHPCHRRRHGRLRRHLRIRATGAATSRSCASRRRTSSAAAPSRRVCMRSTATWACSGTRTSPRTTSATRATTSWAWCARTSATTSPATSTPPCTSSRSGACRSCGTPKTGRYQREGKWQIMIHGESYKPIVAEAARKAATEVYNRIMVTHLLMDQSRNRVAGAVGFNVRTGRFLRLPRQGGDRLRWRRLAHLQATRGRRGHGTHLVRAMEQRVRLRVADPGRRQDDADGEPDRPHALQGWLRPGRRLLPASEDLHAERLR